METLLEREGKPRVYKLKDEKDFYLLIEQRLSEQGYQLMDTLKRIPVNDACESPCFRNCH